MTRDNKIFPMPSNTTCNKKLKAIAELCGKKARLTYHVARHSQRLPFCYPTEYRLKPSVAYFFARPLKLVQTLLKAKRSGGFAVSGRIFLFQSVFIPKTFSLSRLYNGRWRLRKQTTDGKESSKTNNNLNRPRCTIQMSIKIKGCHLYKTNGNGGKRQTALPPENNLFFFRGVSGIIFPCNSYVWHCSKVKVLLNPAYLRFR